MKALTIIPARYGATRLPGKPLSLIHEKPMIQWVYERAQGVPGVIETIVATDDRRIFEVVEGFGGKAMMTSTNLQSGTDRVAEVARAFGEMDIVINLQGDEPLIRPELIAAALQIVSSGQYPIGTLMSRFANEAELEDRAAVKVWANAAGRVLCFSREPSRSVPGARADMPRRHIGVYVFERETLLRFAALPQSESEKRERLEQLRAMDNAIPIGLADVDAECRGVDTPEDLERVRASLKKERMLHG